MVFGPAGPSVLAFVGLVLLFIYLRQTTKECRSSKIQPPFTTLSPHQQEKRQGCETDPLLKDSCSCCRQNKDKCLCDFTSDELNINNNTSLNT